MLEFMEGGVEVGRKRSGWLLGGLGFMLLLLLLLLLHYGMAGTACTQVEAGIQKKKKKKKKSRGTQESKVLEVAFLLHTQLRC
jgi:Na+-transporting methylmalonyl-CoA/oxaloacetate decarboxylase gamma subunit